jgi:hypothetical protein
MQGTVKKRKLNLFAEIKISLFQRKIQWRKIQWR